ncbi:MAG TPA: 23S rRNA (guanosine(2251)-2'-O)-methyltransferase RlmB [Saprospiraceae bacterium]|nr:23S rRNA (guanosine(2251)-2'-O)-methyltransferase RlmB [Saprospiraceae bacterium]
MTRDDIIFGRRPVVEILEKGIKPDKILLQNGVDAEFSSRIRTLAKALEVQVQVVPVQKLNSLTKAAHQGIICFKAFVEYQRVQHVVQRIYEDGHDPLLLLLDRVTDVRNLGAIARSAEVFGAQGLILPTADSAPVNGEAVKASAGALLNIAVCREKSLLKTLDELHDLGITSYAAELNADKNLSDIPMKGPAVIVLGSEDRGISNQLLAKVHHWFRIPQVGQTQSLNVSVAAGIVLYHALMQRTRE